MPANFVSLVPSNLARPPYMWSAPEVKAWLGFCVEEFSLSPICVDKFDMNGKALCLLTRKDFMERAPHAGDVLFNAFQHLRQQDGPSYQCRPQLKSPVYLPSPTQVNPPPMTDAVHGPHAAQGIRSSYVPILPALSANNSTISSSNNNNNNNISSSPHHNNNSHPPIGVVSVANCLGVINNGSSSNGINNSYTTGNNNSNNNNHHNNSSSNHNNSSSNNNNSLISPPSDLASVPASMLSPAPSEKCSSDNDSCHNDNGGPSPHTSEQDIDCDDMKYEGGGTTDDGVCRLLWEFIYQLLQDPKYDDLVSWESVADLTFLIKHPTNLAELWGMQKNRNNMTYEKLSRALRYYYKMNIIKKVPGKRLTYQFLQHPTKIRKGQRGARPHASRMLAPAANVESTTERQSTSSSAAAAVTDSLTSPADSSAFYPALSSSLSSKSPSSSSTATAMSDEFDEGDNPKQLQQTDRHTTSDHKQSTSPRCLPVSVAQNPLPLASVMKSEAHDASAQSSPNAGAIDKVSRWSPRNQVRLSPEIHNQSGNPKGEIGDIESSEMDQDNDDHSIGSKPQESVSAPVLKSILYPPEMKLPTSSSHVQPSHPSSLQHASYPLYKYQGERTHPSPSSHSEAASRSSPPREVRSRSPLSCSDQMEHEQIPPHSQHDKRCVSPSSFDSPYRAVRKLNDFSMDAKDPCRRSSSVSPSSMSIPLLREPFVPTRSHTLPSLPTAQTPLLKQALKRPGYHSNGFRPYPPPTNGMRHMRISPVPDMVHLQYYEQNHHDPYRSLVDQKVIADGRQPFDQIHFPSEFFYNVPSPELLNVSDHRMKYEPFADEQDEPEDLSMKSNRAAEKTHDSVKSEARDLLKAESISKKLMSDKMSPSSYRSEIRNDCPNSFADQNMRTSA